MLVEMAIVALTAMYAREVHAVRQEVRAAEAHAASQEGSVFSTAVRELQAAEDKEPKGEADEESKGEEEGKRREWYEPLYAEYRVGETTPLQHIAVFLMIGVPFCGFGVWVMLQPPGHWVRQLLLV
eukprot:CAMPEP_0119377440 /NCGR_PEP_ID=MMETSP1334-20130426/44957_1 /TAXON_ID=127549 /ORGANISM="Calcidiscus leptoporus, Strain RCC1130" /LENGTH=125 /DNA_ID=CAMNT_0007396367 /DNA_START=153 /DNA_END=531 /DNA_ORIENTATION=+